MKVVEGQRIVGDRLEAAGGGETTVGQVPRERRMSLTTRPP